MKKLLITLFIAATFLISCTDNQRARSWGGTEEITLKPNQVLLTITWKEANMWVVTRDTITNICYAQEKSNLGWVEGTIIINPPTKQ